MKLPISLKQGDKIGIMAPARKITAAELQKAIDIIEENGFEVKLGKSINAEDNQFAGNDEIRSDDLQYMIDNKDIKAILFARGGYGCVRIIDKIDFEKFIKNPKWLAGYSDISVIHSHVNNVYNIQTLHSSMPINFAKNSKEALKTLFEILKGENINYEFESHPLNKSGEAEAEVVGGNFSVLYSILGSKSFPALKGKILFIEDLDEYLYHIDRMMMGLKRAGVFNNLKGVIVGGMSSMNDNEIPFGKTAEEIIHNQLMEFDFPLAFGFPAGHVDDNRAIALGRKYKLTVSKQKSYLETS
ncbi:MAG: LD-carboxypeptidase [Marinilabiliales bacterium]|nr:MAG: LD-carboxypeptidase [Marinilabiliales bacterium]